MRRKIDALAAQIAQAEASAGRATGMAQAVDDLAGKLAVIAPRTQIVEDLEGRLNELHALSADVDRRLSDQLARRTELENLKVICDGVAAQLVDAQQKLVALGTAQAEMEPAMNQISTLQSELESAREALRALKQDEDELRRRSGGSRTWRHPRASWRSMSPSASRRCRASRPSWARPRRSRRSCSASWRVSRARSATPSRSSRRWRTSSNGSSRSGNSSTSDGHSSKRPSRPWRAWTLAWRSCKRLSDDVDRKIQAVADREHVVEAVRRGVEEVHALGLKSQAELAAIAERRAEIAQAKGELDRLRESLAATQEKIVAIESRRQLVDAVQRKADTITHLLGDVQITLESVSEQKAMVDHVFAELGGSSTSSRKHEAR